MTDPSRMGPNHPARWMRVGDTNEDDAISNWHLSLFIQEVALQAGHAMRAWRELADAIAADDVFRAYYHLQAYLTAVGILSSTLWPKAAYRARGEQLRFTLNVPDDSPLRRRTMRDRFTHFDVYLQAAMRDGLRAWVDLGAYADEWEKPPPNRLRHIDTARMRVSMRGAVQELRPLHDAVLAIGAETQQRHWQLVVSPQRIAGSLSDVEDQER